MAKVELRGSTTGRLNVCHADVSIGRGVAALVPRGNPDYFTYAMMALRSHLKATFRGSTFPSITSGHLNNYWLPNPPIGVQEPIARHIDRATAALNEAIAHATHETDLVREFHRRLIADAVTGKVDVRGFTSIESVVANEPSDEVMDDEDLIEDDVEVFEEAAND